MIHISDTSCPSCGGSLRTYDSIKRLVRYGNGLKQYVTLQRKQCRICQKIHRELPDYILPFKQYNADIIQGVVEGLITNCTYSYEDYPTTLTMKRWCA